MPRRAFWAYLLSHSWGMLSIPMVSVHCARFDSIHLDLVGPLPHSHGYSYLLTVIDRFTKWPEALPLPDIRAETIARTFLQGWVARFGTPTTVTTDRGSQFQSDLWSSLMKVFGSHRLRTTAYHPQANGLIKRFHWQLKGALKCHVPQDQWTDALPWMLLGIRSAVKEDSKCTAAELVYMAVLSECRGNSSHLSLQRWSQTPQSSPTVFDPAWLLQVLPLLASLDIHPPIVQPSCNLAHMYSYVVTPSRNPCSHPTTVPSRSFAELTNITNST